jgi:putative hemolysin
MPETIKIMVKRSVKWVILLVILVIIVVISFSAFRNNNGNSKGIIACSSESDCVPDSCCHAKGCIAKESAPNCNGMLCSAECAPGTVDCGQASCKCVNSKCEIIQKNNSQMPNPASVYCIERGNRLEIRSDANGGQYGVCILQNSTECEEWRYYRGNGTCI